MHKLLDNKRIVFLDGDGTIWYPKETKRKIKPHWIYKDEKIGSDFLAHLVIIPTVVHTLEKLKNQDILLILISTHPHPKEEADILLTEKVRYFKLEHLFNEIHTARNYPEGKAEIINAVLHQKGLLPAQALMIGDSYKYDYLSAKNIGVEAILMQSEYLDTQGDEVEKIVTLGDLLK